MPCAGYKKGAAHADDPLTAAQEPSVKHVRYVTEADQRKMPKTPAERQRAWQDRRARLIAALEADNAQLRDVLAEAERLAAQQCRHPAAAVDAGHCQRT